MKPILLLFLLLVSLLTNAQFTKGDKFVGGTFRLIYESPAITNGGATYNAATFSINPLVGFLVNEKLAIGGQIGYSYSNTKYTYPNSQPNNYEYNSSGFSIGLIARRYYSISDKFVFSINGLLYYNRGTEKNIAGTTENKTDNYQLGASIQPGFIFFPSPKWGFEASIGSLGYYYSRNLSLDSGTSSFNLNYGTINFGLYYFFKRSE